MFLDADELRQLTNRVRYSAQAKMLRAMGIEHRKRADGTLVVLRSHVEQVLSGGATTKKKEKKTEPNWDAMK